MGFHVTHTKPFICIWSKGKIQPWCGNLHRTRYRCSTLHCDTGEGEVQRNAPFNLHAADINDFCQPKWLAGEAKRTPAAQVRNDALLPGLSTLPHGIGLLSQGPQYLLNTSAATTQAKLYDYIYTLSFQYTLKTSWPTCIHMGNSTPCLAGHWFKREIQWESIHRPVV